MRFLRRPASGKFAILALVASGLLLFAVPQWRAAEPLPTQISDETFWSMVTEMSEPGGYFQFDNLLSNELGYQFVIPRLLQSTKPGGVYLGVAPEQNFTYIAALKPKIAFITDIRRDNLLELLMYKALFETSETRAEFVSKLFARKRSQALSDKATAQELFTAFSQARVDEALQQENLLAMQNLLLKTHKFALSPEDIEGIGKIYEVFVQAGPGLNYATTGRGAGTNNPTYAELMSMDDGVGTNRSFLATEENYRFIRDMEKKNLIVPLVGDFAGPKTIRAIGRYLKDHDAVVTAFYLSNVEQYLFDQFRATQFYENAATLPADSASTFIRTFSGGFNGGAFRFQSTISAMTGFLEAFKAGRVGQYGDVRNLSQ